ncbi:MAG: hypothetical protein AB1640_22870 [bacterium]
MYELARGPLVWVAFLGFLAGILYRLARAVGRPRRKSGAGSGSGDAEARQGLLRSALRRAVSGCRGWAEANPASTLLSSVFYLCLFVTPLFAAGHVLSWTESWGVSWWSLPQRWSNVMSLAVAGIGLLLFLARILDPAARRITSAADHLVPAFLVAPFVTGLLAYYQVFEYRTTLTIHIVTGALWLVVIPFWAGLAGRISLPFEMLSKNESLSPVHGGEGQGEGEQEQIHPSSGPSPLGEGRR